jgi:acyl-CoA thioesterase
MAARAGNKSFALNRNAIGIVLAKGAASAGIVDTLAASHHDLMAKSINEACSNRPGLTLGEAFATIADREKAACFSGDAPVNVKASLSPDDLARACAEAMWKDDDASQGLGMEIVEVRQGQATLSMTVMPHMVNGQRIAHGGFIFLLADSAFAFACNSHNQRAVAAQCDIAFLRPGRLGDRLVAVAREISRSGRSGIYDVRVSVDDVVIAEFRGHSRAIGGAWLPADDANKQ